MKKIILTIILISLIVIAIGGIFFSLRSFGSLPSTKIKLDCNSVYSLSCDTSQYVKASYKNGEILVNGKTAYSKEALGKYEVHYYFDQLENPFKHFNFNGSYDCLDLRIEKKVTKQVNGPNGVEFIEPGNSKIHAQECSDIQNIDGLGVRITNLINYDKERTDL